MVAGVFLLLLTRPAIWYASALVQIMQIKICTDNSLNLWNIMSFVFRKKSQEQKIVFKPSCGLREVKQRNVLASDREYPHSHKA